MNISKQKGKDPSKKKLKNGNSSQSRKDTTIVGISGTHHSSVNRSESKVSKRGIRKSSMHKSKKTARQSKIGSINKADFIDQPKVNSQGIGTTRNIEKSNYKNYEGKQTSTNNSKTRKSASK